MEVEEQKFPQPRPIEPPQIEFFVLTPVRVDMLNDMVAKDSTKSYTYYGLDVDNYTELMLWLNDVLRYIKELKSLTKAKD